MSRAILLSVNPPHTTNIFEKKKRLEWRRGCLPQGKAYIYETKRGGGCGMVVGEVVFTGSAKFRNVEEIPPRMIKEGCVSADKLHKYVGEGTGIVANFIQHAKRYDEPKELSEFVTKGDCDCMNCRKCFWCIPADSYPGAEDDCDLAYINIKKNESLKPIIQPPQSWCYVEDLL